jgi:hypothetical protein
VRSRTCPAAWRQLKYLRGHGNTIIASNLIEPISGAYDGAITGKSTLVIHADGWTFEGQYRIIGSSGGLAGTHGLGQFSVTGRGDVLRIAAL